MWDWASSLGRDSTLAGRGSWIYINYIRFLYLYVNRYFNYKDSLRYIYVIFFFGTVQITYCFRI